MKVNLALKVSVDPPCNIEFISTKGVWEDTIRYKLIIAKGALWLKITENAREFSSKYNVDSNIVNEAEKLIAEFMPVTLDPTNDLVIREIECKSSLSKQLISSIEWIKPTNHHKPEQKVAFTMI